MRETFLAGRVIVETGDITKIDVDAIVNAANSTLLGGGGVDGAIHAKGGPAILEACRQLRTASFPDGLPTGEAVITTGGLLPAKYVIHTVGPIYGRNAGSDDELLAACYTNSLALARTHGLRSVAFPAISTGVYGFPKPRAAAVSSAAIKEFLAVDESLTDVRLIFFSEGDALIYLENCAF